MRLLPVPDYWNYLPKLFTDARIALGLSNKELAARLDTSEANSSRLTSGDRWSDVDHLPYRAVSSLGVSEVEVIVGTTLKKIQRDANKEIDLSLTVAADAFGERVRAATDDGWVGLVEEVWDAQGFTRHEVARRLHAFLQRFGGTPNACEYAVVCYAMHLGDGPDKKEAADLMDRAICESLPFPLKINAMLSLGQYLIELGRFSEGASVLDDVLAYADEWNLNHLHRGFGTLFLAEARMFFARQPKVDHQMIRTMLQDAVLHLQQLPEQKRRDFWVERAKALIGIIDQDPTGIALAVTRLKQMMAPGPESRRVRTNLGVVLAFQAWYARRTGDEPLADACKKESLIHLNESSYSGNPQPQILALLDPPKAQKFGYVLRSIFAVILAVLALAASSPAHAESCHRPAVKAQVTEP